MGGHEVLDAAKSRPVEPLTGENPRKAHGTCCFDAAPQCPYAGENRLVMVETVWVCIKSAWSSKIAVHFGNQYLCLLQQRCWKKCQNLLTSHFFLIWSAQHFLHLNSIANWNCSGTNNRAGDCRTFLKWAGSTETLMLWFSKYHRSLHFDPSWSSIHHDPWLWRWTHIRAHLMGGIQVERERGSTQQLKHVTRCPVSAVREWPRGTYLVCNSRWVGFSFIIGLCLPKSCSFGSKGWVLLFMSQKWINLWSSTPAKWQWCWKTSGNQTWLAGESPI